MNEEEPPAPDSLLALGETGPREELPTGIGIMVFFFGLGAGLLSAVIWADILSESLSTAFSVFVIALLVLGGIVGLVLLYRKRIFAYLFDVTQTQLASFAEPLGEVARHAMEKNAEAATAAARRLVQLSLARYAWVATRRWIMVSLTALIAAMATLAGTALLFKQNQLLADQSLLLAGQNQRLDDQNQLVAQQTNLLSGQNQRLDEQNRLINLDINLAEAARNAELVVEIAKIGGELAISVADQNTGINPSATVSLPVAVNPGQKINPGLLARVVAVSLAIRPYRFLRREADRRDVGERLRTAVQNRPDLVVTRKNMARTYGWKKREDRIDLISRPTSPERGQLLAVMLKTGISELDIFSFYGLDLSYAKVEIDLIPLASFHQARLAFADFSYTEIGGSNFGGATLDNAWFKKSIIFDTSFASVDGDKVPAPFKKSDSPIATQIAGADFSEAILTDTRFDHALVSAAVFDNALLHKVSFAGTALAASTFRGSVLVDVDFTGAQLQSVDFDGAIVFDENFITKLANSARQGTFKPQRFILEPVETNEVLAIPLVNANTDVRIPEQTITEKQAYRVKRVQPFEQ